MSDEIMRSPLRRDVAAVPLARPAWRRVQSRLAGIWQRFTQGGDLDRILPRLFLVVVFALGSACATIVPIDQVPDETAHIARAAAMLHGALFGRIVERTDAYDGTRYRVSGVMIDSGLQKALRAQVQPLTNLFQPPKPRLTAGEYKHSWTLRWTGHRVFEPAPNALQYFPAFYLPGAVALGVSGWLGASPTLAILLGRLGMLAAFAAMGCAALTLTRRGRPVLFALLCLPMTIGLASSFNQDGQLIAATALACALLTRGTSRSKLVAGILLALVITSKPPYGLFAGLMLLPLSAPGFWRRCLQVLAVGLPGVGWYLASAAIDLVPFHQYRPYVTWPWWPDPKIMHYQIPALNLRVLMSQPLRFLTLPLDYLGHYAMVFEAQGTALFGQNSITLPPVIYGLWFLAILCVFAATMLERPGPVRGRGLDRLWLIAIIVASVFLLMDAIYISWAELGSTEDIGVTGRYFLLFMPVLMLAMPAWSGWADRKLSTFKSGGLRILLTGPAMLMAVFDVIYLPAFLAHKFYLGV